MSGLSFTSLKPEALTWETAFRLFQLRGRTKNLSEQTQGLYAKHLGTFRKWLGEKGDTAPAQVTVNHLRGYLDSCKARGNRSVTVECVYRILRTFWRFLEPIPITAFMAKLRILQPRQGARSEHSLSYVSDERRSRRPKAEVAAEMGYWDRLLVRDGLIVTDPMANIERPQRERRFVKPFTLEQFTQLLEAIDTRDILGLRDYTLIVFAADTGLRAGEVVSLKITDVDWATGSVVVLGKGRKERRVAFGQTARKVLMAWLHKRGTIEGSDWLFVNRYGERMQPVNFQQRVKKWTRAAGIAAERLGPHALRHFFAISFLRNGGDAMSLQKLLGHFSLDMVRNYVNLTDDDALTKHRQASPLDKMGPLPGERRQVRLK